MCFRRVGEKGRGQVPYEQRSAVFLRSWLGQQVVEQGGATGDGTVPAEGHESSSSSGTDTRGLAAAATFHLLNQMDAGSVKWLESAEVLAHAPAARPQSGVASPPQCEEDEDQIASMLAGG